MAESVATNEVIDYVRDLAQIGRLAGSMQWQNVYDVLRTQFPEPPQSGEGCRVCGVEIVWHANNEDWNLATGSPYGYLCPNHFIALYQDAAATRPVWAVRRDFG